MEKLILKEDYKTGKRLEHRGERYAGGAVSYQRSKQEDEGSSTDTQAAVWR